MKGTSYDTTDMQLAQAFDLLNIGGVGNLAEAYPSLVTTRTRTALNHIGADFDRTIQTYFLCPKCWRPTPLSQLYTLETSKCGKLEEGTDTACNGVLYHQRAQVRKPTRVIAYNLLSTFLADLMQDPEVRRRSHEWRGDSEDDAAGNYDAPLYDDRARPYKGEDGIMHGLSDGSVWRRQQAHTQRQVDEKTNKVTEPVLEGMSSGSEAFIIVLWLESSSQR
ncbi:hypothetical protein QFC21_007049 [Naganishia friedmannii]|uniref:Uncharacterized protein n=1 Tax=Naganishia friedmannii TaxID=89922 RepID=A0ACC2UYM6_9TREE|nr:hypothetical protein QFC21_007049 [Naganishia friedmannii]